MRHLLPSLAAAIFVASFIVGVLGLTGCTGTTINARGFAPSSLADVDAVQADVNALRTDTRASIDAVKTDLDAAKIDTTATGKALGSLDSKIEEAKSRPPASGIGGALVSAIAGSGVLPNWLDWIVTVGLPLVGLNTVRNRTRSKALAKVATTPKPPAVTPPVAS